MLIPKTLQGIYYQYVLCQYCVYGFLLSTIHFIIVGTLGTLGTANNYRHYFVPGVPGVPSPRAYIAKLALPLGVYDT